MKTSKKIFSLALALVMSLGLVFSFVTKASANGPSVPADAEPGLITITNAARGEQYTVYQVFGATYNEATKATAYTVSTNDYWYGKITDDANAPFTLTDGTDNTFKYVTRKEGATDTQITDWLKDNMSDQAPIYEQHGATGTKLVIAVPYGYYLIKSTTGTGGAITIDHVNPEREVVDKNPNTPTADEEFKKIKLANGTLVDDSTAKVGDTVSYQVEMTTVNWVNKEGAAPEQVTKYVVTDTAPNLKIDLSSVKVWVGASEAGMGEIENFTKTYENGKLTVTVPWGQVNSEGEFENSYQSGDILRVTYNAEILAGAVTNATAKNNAALAWNEHTPFKEDDTDTFNYKFDIDKVDGADHTKKLAGAEFKLLDAAQNEIELVKVQEEGGVVYYRPATTEEKGVARFEAATPVTDENGYFEIKGLGNGTYYLKETHAPDGYTKMSQPQSFVIENSDKTGSAAIVVENNKGAELPSTGGMGTTIFYTVGGILVVGAAVLLITKKRMDGAQ